MSKNKKPWEMEGFNNCDCGGRQLGDCPAGYAYCISDISGLSKEEEREYYMYLKEEIRQYMALKNNEGNTVK